MSQRKLSSSPKPQYLRVWPYLKIGSLQMLPAGPHPGSRVLTRHDIKARKLERLGDYNESKRHDTPGDVLEEAKEDSVKGSSH